MDSTQRQAITQDFAAAVQMGPDRVLAVSDRIQHYRRDKPELTALCKFERSMQVRRLKTLAPKNWNPADWRAAEAVIQEINHLRKGRGPEHILALAVLGAEQDELDGALALLEQTETANAGDLPDESTRPERQSGEAHDERRREDRSDTRSEDRPEHGRSEASGERPHGGGQNSRRQDGGKVQPGRSGQARR